MAETMKEYLVKIGWDVDKASFKNSVKAIKDTHKELATAAISSSQAFLKTAKIAVEAIVNINEAMFSLISTTAKLDYEEERLARTYWTSKKNARSYISALEALGETEDSVMYMTNEQYARFVELNKLGRSLEAPKELDDYLVKVRNLIFQFDKLKVVVRYATRWVVYWISKFTGNDLDTLNQKFSKFSDYTISHIPQITKVIAQFFSVFYRLGKTIIYIIKAAGNAFLYFVDLLDSQVVRAIAIIGLFGAALIKSPLTWYIGLLTILLLLIEDYIGWKNGWKSAIDWSGFDSSLQNIISSANDLKDAIQPVKDGVDYIWKIVFNDLSPVEILQKLIDRIANSLGLISGFLDDLKFFKDLLSGSISFDDFVNQKSGVVEWFKGNWKSVKDTIGLLTGDLTGLSSSYAADRIVDLFDSSKIPTAATGSVYGDTNNTQSTVVNNDIKVTVGNGANATDVGNAVANAITDMRPWTPKLF